MTDEKVTAYMRRPDDPGCHVKTRTRGVDLPNRDAHEMLTAIMAVAARDVIRLAPCIRTISIEFEIIDPEDDPSRNQDTQSIT